MPSDTMQFNSWKTLIILLSILTGMMGTSSCVKEIDEYQGPANGSTAVSEMTELQIPANFQFNIDRDIQLDIRIHDNLDGPIADVTVDIMTDIPENGGAILFKGKTDASGRLTGSFKVINATSEVIINTDHIGIANNAIAVLQGNFINLTLGGSNPQMLLTKEYKLVHSNSVGYAYRSSSIPNKLYMGTWNLSGVPNYLEPTRDYISGSFLSRINYSLPERRSVPAFHPEYIAANAESNVEITQQADIWLTFVHEGAGFRNSVGFYKYHKNNPPASTNDISAITIVFPNLSYQNSGGGLVSGDKVNIGPCGPDTMIGFVLLSNSYDINTQWVGNGYNQYYSNSNLNPEGNALKRSHNVMLWDSIEQKMIISFEDLHRESNSDDDFNDAVFYLSAFPASAIAINQVLGTTTPVDTDGDGVDDINDDYPMNNELAFNNYYPSASSFGYFAYEDLWPFRGDYDMNDLLLGYRFNSIKNASNQVKKIESKIFIKAAGGSFQHGFGIHLPVPSSFVAQVTGSNLTENYISTNANGTEAGQSEAVIVAFDNSTTLATRPPGYYINTEPGSPVVISDTVHLSIDFITGLPASSLGSLPYNPFLISNQRRGNEIHLPDKEPTDLADQTVFNTGQDRTNQALGRYYKSDTNLPWCINIPGDYGIVIEKAQIMDAYLKFADWCQSGGSLYSNWYTNLPGYRDPSKILNR